MRTRPSSVVCLATLMLAGQFAPARAKEAPLALDIPAQSLPGALNALAEQTGLQIVYETDIALGRSSPAVKGKLTAHDALQRLLRGTGLNSQYLSDHAIAISSASEARFSDTVHTQAKSPLIHLAQASGDAATRIEPDARQTSLPTPRALKMELEEIVVTGSRLRALDVEGPTPVTVFDRQQLDQLGVATIGEVLKYLPEQPYSFSQAHTSAGQQHLELRGLGVGSTLVLINGRRVVPSASEVSFNAFDVNTIPVAAVERVEVLAESASAIYGADALGGVVNVILKKEIPRPVLDLRYGTAAGGAQERRASLSSGYAGERLKASLILDYFDQQPLLGAERDLYRNQDFRRFGGADQRSGSANPGTISSRTGENLPGLAASFAAVPEGSTGLGLTPEDFKATAGQHHTDSLFRYWSIVPAVRRVSAAAFAEAQLAPRLEAFADGMYVDMHSDRQLDPAQLLLARVPASNAFNPFGEEVSADFLLTGIGPRHAVVDSQLARLTLGLRGTLGTWDWEISALRSEEEGTSYTRNNVDVARRDAALAASDPAQALNVFRDGAGGSAALLASLVASPVHNDYASNGALASGFVRGTLGQLPAGPIEAVFGAEWHEADILIDDTRFIDQDRQVAAGYAELRIPLVNEAMGVPAIHGLTLTLAARYDDYSDFGDTLNPQVGLTWQPAASVLLRGGYGEGFRAPSLFELHAPRRRVPLQFVDPRRNGEVINGEAISGGNPDLDPITSQFMTAGIVWSPDVAGAPRLSADFWRIRLDRRVAFFSDILVLAHESQYPQRVVRAAPTPADVAAGLPGQILSVDISRINFGSLDTHGIDFKARWHLSTRLGVFAPSLSATWVGRYRTLDLPGEPQVDRVGLASLDGTITRWRAVGALSWSKDAVGLSMSARYTPSYADAEPFTGMPTGRQIAAQTLVDLHGSLDLEDLLGSGSAWLRGCKLSAGIVNLFDEAPHFAELGLGTGHDMSQGDLRQRFFYAQLSKRF